MSINLSRRRRTGLLATAVVAALATGLVLSVGAAAGPAGQASKLTAKKCKKRPTAKARKKCRAALHKPPATSPPVTAAISLVCVDCAPFGMNPIAHQDSSSISFSGTLSPPGAAIVSFGYAPGL